MSTGRPSGVLAFLFALLFSFGCFRLGSGFFIFCDGSRGICIFFGGRGLVLSRFRKLLNIQAAQP